jgi:signal transduction histidine kinase
MANQMWRAVAAFRIIALVYVGAIIIRDHDRYARPSLGLLVLAIMTCWTVLTVVAYARPAGRVRWLLVADVLVAAGTLISTRWIDSAARISSGAPTLPGVWVAAPVLACAVAGGPWAGLAAALGIAGSDLIEHPVLHAQNTFLGVVLLLIAGGLVGYVVRLGVRAEEATALAARREAAVAERERIARSMHDTVLQVLALVSRRGRALGGEAAELGRLAAEQERELRLLVLARGRDAETADGSGLADVRGAAELLADATVTVACPATPVLLPAAAAQALSSAAAAAVDNVRRHAGPDARCWVLLEDDGEAVTLTVRDDGQGIAAGRLAEAADDGRLGVSHSIIGRMRKVGGTATLTSTPGQGTEVELVVPRAVQRQPGARAGRGRPSDLAAGRRQGSG